MVNLNTEDASITAAVLRWAAEDNRRDAQGDESPFGGKLLASAATYDRIASDIRRQLGMVA